VVTEADGLDVLLVVVAFGTLDSAGAVVLVASCEVLVVLC
jgi:hypothetical protein